MENWTKIQCGNDEFNLQHISFTLISARSTRNKSTAMAQLRENIENVLNKYWYAVAKELPSPHPDYINKKKSTFSVRGIEQNGEAEVVWEYWYDTNNPGGTFVAQSTHSLSLTKDIIPSIEKLLKQKEESIKKAGLLSFLFELAFDPVNTIFHDDSTKEQSAFSTMKQELSDVYKQYLDEQKFEEQHELLIFFNNGRGLERYLQDKCGFDIFEKEKEINQKLLEYREKQRKLKNSFNHGENNVEYIIKWFVASNDGKHILAIKGDCESKYRYDCILLRNPEFIDEPQEYDHILVTPAGIVIIETKDWKGTIDINADGKWIRYKEDDGSAYGASSPITQMRRHEQLMKSIFPNVPVHSILCFSNPSAIINGKDNIFECQVINIEQLEDVLNSICKKKKYSEQEIDNIVDTIESCKINRR